MPSFKLAIQTPTQPVFEGEVEAMVAPGADGALGILAHHAPLITTLAAGPLDLETAGGEVQSYFISGGFLEVSRNRAIVLADHLERVDEIDVDEAEGELTRERNRTVAGADVALAEQRIAGARARLRAAKRARGESRF